MRASTPTRRAVATAIFGDATKVKHARLAPAQRLVAVQSGEVDVAYANITWTMTRETKSGVQFANVNFYDAWGFLVPKASGVSATTKLNGASVCMLAGPGESNAAEYFGKIKVRYKAVPFSEGEQMRKAFLAKRCDVMFHDVAAIASFKATLGARRRLCPSVRDIRARAAGRRGPQGRRALVRHRAPPSTRWSLPRSSASRRRTSRRSPARPIRSSSACSASMATSARRWASTRSGPPTSSRR
jgi:hypothetical protein